MRKIIHVDMDAFFASVEQRDFPEYLGKPVIVGGKPERRGVVAACSYEARKFGIHSAMSSARAIKLCPDAVFLPPRFEAYRECSKQIHSIFREFTDLIEPLSLDEAYLDVSACDKWQGSATLIALAIKSKIKTQIDLTASAGVSYNMFLAKIASDMDKPDGLYVVKPQDAQALIETLPVRKFFGVGKVTESKMHKRKIFTGADLKALTKEQLQIYFGKSGNYYYNITRGIDDRPIRTSRVRKSIGKETTFVEDLTDKKQIWQTLIGIAEKLADLLDSRFLTARTVTIKVKYHDFQLITRSQTLVSGLQTEQEILQVLPELLRKTDIGEKPIRLIGISLSSLMASDEVEKISVKKTDKKNQYQLGLF